MNKDTNLETVVCDIDGTISDRRHRLKHLEGKKDWDAFFSEMHKDPPIKRVVKKIEEHSKKEKRIIFVTGRPEDYRNITEKWIKENVKAEDFLLLMRPSNNYERDVIIKNKMKNEILNSYKIIKVYEDQKELFDMWEEAGLDCELCNLD